ncbi:B- and T-lymphocyte attenuator isoform X2 [Ascaphus truei]|uniref:B- and T-lymphocyte attenuator isoform X2 n=1 Tax=Ascaphus truei TaxID=8439 RepID=UPI003F59612D
MEEMCNALCSLSSDRVQQPCAWKECFAALHHLMLQRKGNESCSITIHIPRNSHSNASVGDSLTLRCPIRFCSEKLPNVTWDKLAGEQYEPLKEGLKTSSEWTELQQNNVVHLLTFVSVQVNDTGFYRCSAADLATQSVAHAINVSISERIEYVSDMDENTTITTPSPNSTRHRYKNIQSVFESIKWVVYLLVSLGVLCILIMVCSLVGICLRRLKAKRRMPPDTLTNEEIRFVATPQGSTQRPAHSDALSYCSPDTEKASEPIESPTEYAIICNPAPATSSSPEEQDAIVYCDLKHVSIDSNRMRNEHLLHDETEYAVVCMNN